KIFLTPNNSEEDTTPKPLAPLENALSELREWRHSPRRIGVSTTAPAVSLRDEVATEIAARLHSNPSQDASFDTTGEDDSTTTTRAGVTTSNEGMERAGSGSTVSSLPLGARLKPRGIFEDDWTATLSTQRPWPVILLHGTCDSTGIWQLLGSDLREDGWAVFAADYWACLCARQAAQLSRTSTARAPRASCHDQKLTSAPISAPSCTQRVRSRSSSLGIPKVDWSRGTGCGCSTGRSTSSIWYASA